MLRGWTDHCALSADICSGVGVVGRWTDHCALRAGICSGVGVLWSDHCALLEVGRMSARFARGCARGVECPGVGRMSARLARESCNKHGSYCLKCLARPHPSPPLPHKHPCCPRSPIPIRPNDQSLFPLPSLRLHHPVLIVALKLNCQKRCK